MLRKGHGLKFNELIELVVRWTDRLLAASFILALAAYGYVGFFSRYMADDYGFWTTVNSHGLVGAQVRWYVAWSGRFSFLFVADLCSLLGPRFAQFLPALLLAIWVAGMTWSIRRMARRDSPKTSYVQSLLFAGLVILATLKTAPNVVQSLFWQDSALNYVPPLILLTLYVGFISSRLRAADARAARPSALSLCGSALFMFIAGGFSEAYLVLQTSGLILAIIAGWRYAPDRLKPVLRALLIAGLVGSLLALVVVVLAPGNRVRLAFFPPAPGPFQILKLASIHSCWFIAKAIFHHPFVLAVAVLLPFLIAFRRRAPGHHHDANESWRYRAELLVLLPAAVLLLSMCCTASAFYGMSVMLPERSQVLLSFTLVCGTVVWGHSAGTHCRVASPFIGRRVVLFGSTLALIAMITLPVASGASIFGLRSRARAYAADWDRQDEDIRAAKNGGARELTVEQIGDFQSRLGLGNSDLHLRTDRDFWINRAVAKYYGIDSIAASQEPTTSHEVRVPTNTAKRQ
jgi:hypothetical protein